MFPPIDIVSGNEKIILGLVWSLILHFQIGTGRIRTALSAEAISYLMFGTCHLQPTTGPQTDASAGDGNRAVKEKLLQYVDQECNKKYGLAVKNFTSEYVHYYRIRLYIAASPCDCIRVPCSFKDGKAICALVNSLGQEVFDVKALVRLYCCLCTSPADSLYNTYSAVVIE